MKNKLKTIGILAAALLLVLGGCGSSGDTGESGTASKAEGGKTESKVIRIGDQSNYYTAKVAVEKGFLKKEFGDDYTFELSTFADGPAATEAFVAGQIDFALYGDTAAVQAYANGTDIRIISSFMESPDGFKLIVGKNSGIETLADLKGKRIAFSAGSNDHKLILKFLEAANLTTADVTLVNLASADNIPALAKGEIDAFLGQEPNIDNILEQTGGKIIADNKGIETSAVFVLVDQAYAQANSDNVVRLLKAFAQATEWMEDNQEEAHKLVADYNGSSVENLKKYYETRQWSITWNNELTKAVQGTIDFAYDQGNIPEKFDVFDLADTSYLEKAGLYQKSDN